MKREIFCCTCFRKLDYLRNKYPGENIKIIIGNMRGSAICDHCGDNLEGGDAAVAVSTWTDAQAAKGRGHYPWEDEFIIPVVISDRDFSIIGTGYIAQQRKEF